MKRITSLLLVMVLLSTIMVTSCAKTKSASGYVVVNSSASDASAIAAALNADYRLTDKTEELELEGGATVAVCTSYNNYPFDLSTFNDEGYIIRRVDDDVIICGKNENATALAIDHFTDVFTDGDLGLIFANELNYVHGAADRLGKVTLGDVDISEYKIVIPKKATVFEEYAAQIFYDHLFDAGGISLEITDDSTAENQYEIIIGNTSRAQTPSEREYETMEFYLGIDGNDLVLDGNGYMVGGGVGKLIADYLEPEDCGDVSLDGVGSGAIYEYEAREADSAILMIGDGFGFNHIDLAMLYGTVDEFYAYSLPAAGEAITYSYDGLTDSAAAGTALSTGFKTYNSAIGLDLRKNPLKNIRELAHESGARTAVITSDFLDGATPSAFLSHATERTETEQIRSCYPGITVEYAQGYVVYEVLEYEQKALSIIAESGDPFFIMIEEGMIDKFSHSRKLNEAANMVGEFNKAIAYTMTYAACHTDTFLLITADHETGGLVSKKNGQVFSFTTNEHTNVNVPIFAIGEGAEKFNGAAVENIAIPNHIAAFFGDEEFGHLG